MKLEHKKQNVAPFSDFLVRIGKYGLYAFILVVFSVAIGTLGYFKLGNLSLLDSFYMACMILTGMGPVVELSTQAGKLFSSFYALYSGVAFLSITAVYLAPIVHRVMHILHVDALPEKRT